MADPAVVNTIREIIDSVERERATPSCMLPERSKRARARMLASRAEGVLALLSNELTAHERATEAALFARLEDVELRQDDASAAQHLRRATELWDFAFHTNRAVAHRLIHPPEAPSPPHSPLLEPPPMQHFPPVGSPAGHGLPPFALRMAREDHAPPRARARFEEGPAVIPPPLSAQEPEPENATVSPPAARDCQGRCPWRHCGCAPAAHGAWGAPVTMLVAPVLPVWWTPAPHACYCPGLNHRAH